MLYSTCLALLNTTEASSWMLAPFTALDSTVEASVKVCLMLSIALESHNFQVTKREYLTSNIYSICQITATASAWDIPDSARLWLCCHHVTMTSRGFRWTRRMATLPLVTRGPGTRSPWPCTHWSPDPLPRWPRRWWPVVSGPSRGHVRGGTLCTGTRRHTGGHWRPSQLVLPLPRYWSCQATTTRPIYGQGHWGREAQLYIYIIYSMGVTPLALMNACACESMWVVMQ